MLLPRRRLASGAISAVTSRLCLRQARIPQCPVPRAILGARQSRCFNSSSRQRGSAATAVPGATSGARCFNSSSRQGQGAAAAAVAPSSFNDLPDAPAVPSIPQTLTEKIVQRYAVGLAPGKRVKSGDYVTLQPAAVMTHDNTWPVAMKYLSLGATKIHDPRQIVFTLDHDVQNSSETNMKKYKNIQEFARTHGIDFYPAGRGIGHQIMIEEGYVWPGTVCVASDSHSNTYGSVCCVGTPVVRTDAASLWATGKTWWQVPPIAKVTLTGRLPKGVSGKDIIVALCGILNKDEVLNHVIEFSGSEETLRTIPIDDRITVANMTTEWGCLAGVFPIDGVLEGWLRAKATTAAMLRDENPGLPPSRFTHERINELMSNTDLLRSDPGATYAKSFYLNLSTLSPFVSGPNSVKVATPVNKLEEQKIKVDKTYLVSCTNSRASDIQAAANVFRAATPEGGPTPKVAPGVKFYIAAASLPEQALAEERGDWQVLLDAGAEALPSGCGPCIGLGKGLLEPGEVGVSASNRNFKGRMGSTDAKAYLASPEVVAASALKGIISGPGTYEKPEGVEKVIIGEGEGNAEQDKALSVGDALDKLLADLDSLVAGAEKELGVAGEAGAAAAEPSKDDDAANETLTEVLEGFPERVEGEIVFCDADNINTDGIYPGKYTYQDYVPVEKMAEVCMENYDPEFRHIAKAGDILVAGFNFGCGSSREQAATAILAKKIPLVVSGSFGNIFSRNSINNALMGVEVPRLVQRLRESFPAAKKGEAPGPATRRTGWKFVWDVRRSKVTVTEGPGGETWSQKVGELPPNVQEIIARGGLENWVKSQLGT